jgi:hypothetical protein
VSQDPQVLMDQNQTYLGNRCQMPASQNPNAILQQTGNSPYSMQNITQGYPSIYAQQQMPTESKLKTNQSIPLGMDGPYAHQSLQPIRPLSNPKYDDVPDENIHIATVETHSEMTHVKQNGAKRGRESQMPDESKVIKRKGQKLNNEEETEEERGSNKNEIARLQEEMRQMREEMKEREQGPFFKDYKKDRQTKQESEKQQQQQRQQQQRLLQQQILGQHHQHHQHEQQQHEMQQQHD